MGIYIFTKKGTSLKAVFPKNAEFTSGTLSRFNPDKTEDTPWGIIDTKGSVKDVAALFFDGASDYLGPSILKKSGIDAKRIKKAQKWRITTDSKANNSAGDTKSTAEESAFINSGVKLPSTGVFPGWKKINSGKVMPFYLLHCSITGKTSLEARLGEKTAALVYKRFQSLLTKNFSQGDGLLWMDTGKDCLFLFPPKAKNIESALMACIRMLINSPLIAIEMLGLSVPADFAFALHYGSISYKPPGKTGTVVSDAVNAVFHLGTNKAEPGRLTITCDIPDVSIPKSCQNLFSSCGMYESRKIWHTKKFNYANLL
jgi:hypothetical protein